MPRRNRVTPFSTLIATSARGTLMGNRGCLHGDDERIRRQFQGKRWIICLLDFKGRKRPLMVPRHYTELFFLDEATALAAGHRPCAECQRDRFNVFREHWARANRNVTRTARPTATVLDTALHKERIAEDSRVHRFSKATSKLPDGVFVSGEKQIAHLVLGNRFLRWSPAGYAHAPVQDIGDSVRVLTPASVVRALSGGYPIGIHESAFQTTS